MTDTTTTTTTTDNAAPETPKLDIADKIEQEEPGSAESVRAFFEGMNMPIPRILGDIFFGEAEFYMGTGCRKLVFVSEYGIILRFTPPGSQMGFDNPHFIKPLFSRAVGNYTVDIDPGYDCPVTYKEMKDIYTMLKRKYGVVVSDGKPHNLCFVPDTNPRFPVVIDLDAGFIEIDDKTKFSKEGLEGLRRSVWDVRRWLPFLDKTKTINHSYDFARATGEATPQDTIYAPLREIIEGAWPANQNVPDPAGIEEFKEACRAFKEAGKLKTPWTDPVNSYSNTMQSAALYAERMVNG